MRDIYVSAATNVTLRLDCLQLLGFAYLHGLSCAWLLSGVIGRRESSLRKLFDRARNERFPLRNPADNAKDSVYFSQRREFVRKEEKIARDISQSVRQIDES